VILAVGTGVIVTGAVAVTAGQPPLAATVYVTVYVPGILVLGVIAPVLELNVKPVDGFTVYTPPVYAPVPVRTTNSFVACDKHNGVP
jgi:hypothetical protein